MGVSANGRVGVMAMKWPNRIAQGFSPGLAQWEIALPVRRSSGNVGRRRKGATDEVRHHLWIVPVV